MGEHASDGQARRVAVVQTGSAMFDTARTLDRIERYCERLQREGIELAVFPEALLGGYPKGLDFGARVGSRSAAGREDFRRYWESAIEIPGPEEQRVRQYAAAMRCTLVVGAVERVHGTLYCAALIIGHDGTLLGVHRKLMPTASERLIWGMGDGSHLPVVDTPVGRVGAIICWENYMPALRLAMHAKGIQLWCAPTVDDRDMWAVSMRHIAYEGRCFVLSACQFLTRDDCPQDYAGPDGVETLIRGGSLIAGPFGDLLAGPLYDREGILFADIDPADAIRGKYDLDVAGHYARPDVFALVIDERAKSVTTSQIPPVEEQVIPVAETPSPSAAPCRRESGVASRPSRG